MNARGWVILAIIVILTGAIVLYWTRDRGTQTGLPPQSENIQAHFACDGGKTIDATFVNTSQSTTTGNSVALVLSDGRQMTLPQAISADGARYANQDESLVFWNVGNGATVTESGTDTYKNCTTGS